MTYRKGLLFSTEVGPSPLTLKLKCTVYLSRVMTYTHCPRYQLPLRFPLSHLPLSLSPWSIIPRFESPVSQAVTNQYHFYPGVFNLGLQTAPDISIVHLPHPSSLTLQVSIPAQALVLAIESAGIRRTDVQ